MSRKILYNEAITANIKTNRIREFNVIKLNHFSKFCHKACYDMFMKGYVVLVTVKLS